MYIYFAVFNALFKAFKAIIDKSKILGLYIHIFVSQGFFFFKRS